MTYLPKRFEQRPKIDPFPSPHHQTTPPLPLTSSPWPHHVLYWLGTGWWCLGLARASLLNLSKRLPAAHASAVTWRLSFCVSGPLCGLSFGPSLQSETGLRMMMGFIFLVPSFCFSLLPAVLAYSSCCNDSILLGPFLGLPFYFFSQWPTIGTVLFIHGLLCPFVFFFWASTAHLLILLGFLDPFANSTLPWALLLTSLGFPGPITLSLSLGFMGLP